METKSFPLIECFIYAPFTSINGNESFSKVGNQFLYLLPFWFPHISINEIVDRLKSDLKDIKTFASRWAEQAWRIAVNLHASARAHTNDLSLDTAEKAIAITEWFALQQLDILSAGRESAWQKIKDKILPLLDENPNGIKGWHVSRKRFTRFAQEGEKVLKRMEAEGILISREKRPEGGGPISRIYTRAKRA